MDIQKVSIHQMIVHKINHKDLNIGLEYSDLDLPVEEHKEVVEAMKEHLVNSCNHRYISDANFISDEDWQNRYKKPKGKAKYLKSLCDRIFEDQKLFVDKSQLITKHLFNEIKSKAHISQGDLVICTFMEEPESELKLAIFKMDIKDLFKERIEFESGQKKIVLEKIEGFATGILQKCAFILPAPKVGEYGAYDLKVLDFQQKFTGKNNPVASFFSDDFLQCQVILTPAQMTSKYLAKGEKAISNMKEKISDEEFELLFKKLLKSIQAEVVDIISFADNNIPDPDLRKEFKKEMEKLPTMSFEPDDISKEQYKEKVIFTGDNGLRIEIYADDIGERKTMVVKKPKSMGVTEVKIETSVWEEKHTLKREPLKLVKNSEETNIQQVKEKPDKIVA
jgi:37-kD nucleoid-associated bacterial protein